MNLSKISLFAVMTLAAALPAKSDLIHQYVFNGNVNDQVAGGVDGVLHGDATAVGGVLSLDGNADWVSFGNNFLLPFGSDFTLLLKAKYNYDGNTHEFISQGNSGGPGFYLGPYGNEIRVGDNYGWTAAPAFNGSCGGGCTGVEAPTDGDWHTYAVIVAGNNGAFYIDGILRATKANYITNGGAAPTVLGAQFGGGQNENFNGLMQDVRIYDNALSASEVQSYGDAPEPGTIVLMGTALAGGAWFARRKRTA